jgi:carboxypeptidase C (cathepsin A)
MLPFILENTSYRVLVYNGQFDLRCGAMGTSEWMRLMLWSGRAGFNYADQQVFVDSQNKTVGVFKGYKNLTQLIVYNSGHMVPHDQGPASLEMLRRFINVNNNKGSLCRPSDTKVSSFKQY